MIAARAAGDRRGDLRAYATAELSHHWLSSKPEKMWDRTLHR